MTQWNKNNSFALVLSALVHLVVIAILYFIVLPHREYEERGGVLVNIGEVDWASGTFTPSDVQPQPQEAQPPSDAPNPTEEELLTQESEEAPVVPEPSKVKAKKTLPAKSPQKQLSQEKKQQQQQEQARKQREQEQKRRQDAITKSVSGAFGSAGKGSGNASEGEGREGSPEGNVDQGGLNTGVGGYGSFNLSGRSLRGGGLPRPSYTSQVEGKIVINITVDPSGKVILATFGRGTNIDDYSMRQSALQAAKRALFNEVRSLNNQTGSITYTYRLR